MTIIAVATDFSPPAEIAFVRALGLAVARSAELLVISADTTIELIPTTPEPELAVPTWTQLRTDVENEEQRLLAALVERARAAGVTANAIRAVGDPVDVTVKVAREQGVELLVVGSHGRTGITRFLLGSVAERIVEHAPISVLVARGDGAKPFTRVLVASDFSPLATQALTQAQRLASADAAVVVVNAWHYPAGAWSLAALGERTHASTALESALTEPPRVRGEALVADEAAAGRTIQFRLLQGQPADVVTDVAAREQADLIAIGTHGRTGVRRLVLGSVAAAVMRHAPCSVLIARGPVEPEAKPADAAEPAPAPDGSVEVQF